MPKTTAFQPLFLKGDESKTTQAIHNLQTIIRQVSNNTLVVDIENLGLRKKIIIAVAAQKGGVTKTTTAVTLASFLARLGYKVLLCDTDGQCNATSTLYPQYKELKKSQTIATILKDYYDASGIIRKTYVPNLSIIPSHTSLSKAEKLLATFRLGELKIKDLVDRIDDSFDFIIFDCPPNANVIPTGVLIASDYFLLPVTPGKFDLDGIKMILEIAKDVKPLNKNLRFLGIVMTKYNARQNLDQDIFQLLKSKFGDAVFETKIPMNVSLAEAETHAKDIYSYKPDSTGAISYTAFFQKELLPKLYALENE